MLRSIVFAGCGLTHAALAATALLSGSAPASSIFVDGIDAGAVVSWEGGDRRASVVATAVPGGTSTKRVGASALAPLVVRVAFPPAPALASWINEVAEGRAPRHAVVLADVGNLGQTAEAYEVQGAMLTEIVFPAFDATKTVFDPMRLVFAGESARAVAPPTAGIRAVRATGAGFALAMAGLDTKGVMRIEPIRIVQSIQESDVGAARIATKVAGVTEASNVTMTLSAASAASWRSWLTDLVVTASGPGATKRDGAINLIEPTGKVSAVAVTLTGCGIMRVSRPPETAGVPASYQVELFCERIAFGGLAAPVTATSAATAATAPAAPLAAAAPAVRTPIAAGLPPRDKGVRDPALFPRVPGLVRTSYGVTYDKSHTSELASYAAGDTLDQLTARVEAAATAAGWSLRNLSETEGSGSRRMHQSWLKDTATVTLTFIEKEGVAGSALDMQVYVNRLPPQ